MNNKTFSSLIILIALIGCTLRAQNKVQTDSIIAPKSQASVDTLRTDTLIQQMQLNEVSVNGGRIIRNGNKETYTITREMRKGAFDIGQMLGNIPGMDYDRMNKEIRYQGSTNVIILVDSLEKDADYLKGLNHLRFEKVELIHHPTGRYQEYDLIINLHRKKTYEGYEGNVGISGNYHFDNGNGRNKRFGLGRANGSFTYTRNKWNLAVNHNFSFFQYERAYYYDKRYLLNNLREECIPNADGSRNNNPYQRFNNTSISLDYEINKSHSLSASYRLGANSTDTYDHATLLMSSLDDTKRDTIKLNRISGSNEQRHTIGLYYRGKIEYWNIYVNFNYVDDSWENRSRTERTSGYIIQNNRKNQMNYTWGNADVIYRTKDDKLYLNIGYANYWKRFMTKRLETGQRLSLTNNVRHDIDASVTYNKNKNTSFNLNGSVQLITDRGENDYKENYAIWRIGGMAYHRFNPQIWTRLNFWSNYQQPNVNNLISYGEFTDSLQWSGGNPKLRANTSYNARLLINLFSFFNLMGGMNYAPHRISVLQRTGIGMRPDGINGPYIAIQPQNAEVRQWWMEINLWKKWKEFTFSGWLNFTENYARYNEFHHHRNGLSGNITTRYYNEKLHLYVSLSYSFINGCSTTPQSWGETTTDKFTFSVQQTFLNNSLNVGLHFSPPLHFTSGNSWSITDTPAVWIHNYSNNQIADHNFLHVNLSYRFQGGKTVRQYNREIQNEQ